MRRELRPDEPVNRAIVEAVAAETGRDPASMRPFAEVIDADAVDALFAASSGTGPRTLTVSYEGCRVTVDGEVVTVEPLLGV